VKGSANVTGITWKGSENLTQVADDQNGNASAELWVLAAPSAGTDDVVISMTAASRMVGAASTYTGVDQNVPFRIDAVSTNNGTDASPTVDIVAFNNEMVVDSMSQVSVGPDTATGNHPEIHDAAATGALSDVRGASQERASTGATESMTWTMSDSDNWAICSGPLQEPFVNVTPEATEPIASIERPVAVGYE